MNKFLKNISGLIIFLVLFCFLLDQLYTYAHYSGSPRNVADQIMSFKEEDTLDFAVFGSSRVLHTLDINLIEKESGKKGFSFAIPGSSLFEIKLGVQQIVKRKISKNIYIQVDYIWNEDLSGGESEVPWLTYIKDESIWSEFKKLDENNKYKVFKMVPFYRYCVYDSKLGLRELFLSLSGKESNILKNKGYEPLTGVLKDSTETMNYELREKMNPHIKQIIDLCEKEKVNLFFFTSPIFNFKGNNQILEKNLSNYTDFTNAISNPSYFRDVTHLNWEGSASFTEIFTENYFH